LALNRWTTLAGVLKNLALAYLGSQGVQAFCCTRYFDGQEAARALAPSVSRLQLHFADLDDGLGVRVIRNIGHDFLRVPPKTRFKCFDGIELKLSDCQIGSGGAWRSACNAVFDGHALQHRPKQPLYQRNVGLAVVRDIKSASRTVWIHDRDFDDRSLPKTSNKNRACKLCPDSPVYPSGRSTRKFRGAGNILPTKGTISISPVEVHCGVCEEAMLDATIKAKAMGMTTHHTLPLCFSSARQAAVA